MGALLAPTLLEAADGFAVILNAQRQILAANPKFLGTLGAQGSASCAGARLGEVMGCVHMGEGLDGCGTSRACGRCGMLASLITSQGRGQACSEEWLVSLRRDGVWEAREYRVRSTPFQAGGHDLILMTFQDSSAETRRQALEQVFIQDLMASLEGIRSWTELIQGAGVPSAEVAEQVLEAADQIRVEVESKHQLLQAERGRAKANLQETTVGRLLEDLVKGLPPRQADHLLRPAALPDPGPLLTDAATLGRVLEAMVQNAFEAMPPGGQATISFELRAGCPTFLVQHPGCLSPEAQDRVFRWAAGNGSGPGHVLGTYGMKVLGERVLGGQVGFTTSWDDGTRFFIQLPAGILVPRCLPPDRAPSAGTSSSER